MIQYFESSEMDSILQMLQSMDKESFLLAMNIMSNTDRQFTLSRVQQLQKAINKGMSIFVSNPSNSYLFEAGYFHAYRTCKQVMSRYPHKRILMNQ